VLILVENLSVPRDQRVWQEALALTRAGYRVTVICPRGDKQDREPFEHRDGVDIHRFAPSPSDGSTAGYVREYAAALVRMASLARRLARAERFDIVQACNPPDVLLLAVLPLRWRGARFVFDHHDLVPELYRARFGESRRLLHRAALAMELLAFKLADVVISTNESFREIAIARGGKRPEDVFVVRNGPDVQAFLPGEPDPAHRRAEHVIGYVGTMGPQDGVDQALRALALLAAERGDWHAVFAGDGDALPGLRRLAHELGLDDRVRFAGHLTQAEVVRLLSSVDVCMAPEPFNALNDSSTLIKVAEYMALERPIVSFDLKETRVTAADAAVYAPENDVAAYARLLGELLDDPERRSQMGTFGRQRVERQLAWSHSERALLAAYDRCLDASSPSFIAAPHAMPPG
jgi:glycosyltransferase involved in cell wall biosynthesis